MTLVVRAQSDLASSDEALVALVPGIRQALRGLDASLPLGNIATLDAELADRVAPRRFNTVLLAAFAGLALVLSLVGIYGVVVQWVGERTREIGVRMALGAGRGEVLHWVLGQGLPAPIVGLVVGLGLSFGGAQALRSLLFEVGTLDPLTYVVVSVVVLVVATVATLWPALRACRMPPVRALRND